MESNPRQTDPSRFCALAPTKGEEFLRTCKSLGCAVLLLTVEKFRHANWPREAIDEMFFMPPELPTRDMIHAVSYAARTRHIDRIVALDEFGEGGSVPPRRSERAMAVPQAPEPQNGDAAHAIFLAPSRDSVPASRRPMFWWCLTMRISATASMNGDEKRVPVAVTSNQAKSGKLAAPRMEASET